MGSTVHVIVDGPAVLGEWALDRIAVLERRWSRFLADSEVSRLNAAAGAPVVVSADTARLVDTALAARSLTAGLCDPFVLDAVEAIGYDRPYESLEGARDLPGWASLPDLEGSTLHESPISHGGAAGRTVPALSVERFAIGDNTSVLRLPGSVRLDPGSIGKGLAADIVAHELCERGARSALVNIGGDLAAAGDRPQGWPVRIDHPISRDAIATVQLVGGGLATSSTLLRTWTRGDTVAHHLVDPSNGESLRVEGDAPVVATVIASSGWEAEAIATWALVAGSRVTPTDRVAAWAPAGSWMSISVDSDGFVTQHGAAGCHAFEPAERSSNPGEAA